MEHSENSSVWRSILFFIGLVALLVLLGLVFFPAH